MVLIRLQLDLFSYHLPKIEMTKRFSVNLWSIDAAKRYREWRENDSYSVDPWLT